MSKNRYLNFLNCLIIIVVICSTRGEEITLTGILDPEIIIGDEPTTAPTTAPITTPKTTPQTTSGDNSTVLPYERASSSGGLSTGGIVGIVIPCVAALIGVGAAAALCKAAPAAPMQQVFPVNYIDASLDKFTAPMQEVVVQQPPPVQEIPVQPVQLVEQPVVQPVQMVQKVPVQPVQIVQHVPVKHVPVHPVPQQMALVQEVIHQPVQLVEHVPVIEHVPVVEQVPVVGQVSVVGQVPAVGQVPGVGQVSVIQHSHVVEHGIPLHDSNAIF